MHKGLIFLIGFILIQHSVTYAALNVSSINHQFDTVINLAKSDGENKKTDSVIQAKNFNPQAVFDHYTAQPEQTKYYKGVRQKNTSSLTTDALQEKKNGVGEVIASGIENHPQFVITPSDPDMQRSQLLQREAEHIIHGVTSQYIDCKSKEVCTTQYQKKFCEEAPQKIFQSCQKKLKIKIIAKETVTHYPLVAHLSTDEHSYAGVSMNAQSGGIGFLGPHDAHFRLDGRLPSGLNCQTLQGKVISKKGKANLDYIYFPSCSNGLALDFHYSGGYQLDLQIDIVSKVITYEVKDQWIDECTSIATDTTCKLQSQQCTLPNLTQTIQGISVTRDCWQHQFEYICRNGNGVGNCSSLQKEGCQQVGSDCKEKRSGQCSLYLQTYQCPIQSCSPTMNIVCGNGKEYCLDGNCVDHSYKKNEDFAKGASAISAAIDAGKQLEQSSLTIFAGQPTECSEKPIGYSNCCSETGWGQDIHLDHCPDAAKKLHIAREKKLAIKVGRYCSGPEPFPCIEHTQVYCVFGSKLAKSIQEQGRSGQLHIGFGRAKDPNCQGITPEQLQSIDLSKIDFSEFIGDLHQNLKDPDLKRIQQLIEQHVQQTQKAGQADG